MPPTSAPSRRWHESRDDDGDDDDVAVAVHRAEDVRKRFLMSFRTAFVVVHGVMKPVAPVCPLRAMPAEQQRSASAVWDGSGYVLLGGR